MSHVAGHDMSQSSYQFINESCHTWKYHVTRVNESCHTLEHFVSTHMQESCHTLQDTTWVNHRTSLQTSHVMSHIWAGHVNRSNHTRKQVTAHIWTSLVEHYRIPHESTIIPVHKRVMSYILAGHVNNTHEERWGAGVETQKNVRGEIGWWGRVPFNEPYAPLLSIIYDGA